MAVDTKIIFKAMPDNSGKISMSNTGSMTGNMQAVIGNNNIQSIVERPLDSDSAMSRDEVIEILSDISQIISDSELSAPDVSSITKYINKAKSEIEDEANPSKSILTAHLNRANENLEALDKTLETSTKVTRRVLPLLTQVWQWLEVLENITVF